jgi:colanic acid biosynthesis glycosyl transferase WcaI
MRIKQIEAKRILVVTPYYYPDMGPSVPLITMLSEDLVSFGHSVTVLATVPHFPSGKVDKRYNKGLWSWDEREGVRICRIRIPSGDRSNMWHRMIVFGVYQILASIMGLLLDYELVVITNPALETGLPFGILAWLRRKPAIYCVWDLYPEVGVRLGVFKNTGVIRIVKMLEDFCLRNAQAIHALSENFIPNLQERISLNTKIFVVLPWLDINFIHPLDRRNLFSNQYGLNDKFVILYAGNLGLSQGLDKVLQAAKQIEEMKNIQFIFVGDGPNREKLIELTTQLKLMNVCFIPFQPRERLPEVLATADIALVSLDAEIETASIPSKTFPILASGRPILVIVEDKSDLQKIIQESGAGVCIPPGNVEKMVSTIHMLYNDRERLRDMGIQARKFAIVHHSRINAAYKFDEMIKCIS